MKIRLAADLQSDSIVDGIGIRTVIWTQGCSHNCKGCHNPETHDFKGGALVDLEDVIDRLKNLTGQTGITFSGGDPMFQAKQCAILAKKIHDLGMDIWVYTGFTFEELLESGNKDILDFLSNIDVLVDGRFKIEEKSFDLEFRGSRNQRIIDVPKSLENHEVILFKFNDKNENNFIKTEEVLYI